MRASTEVPPFVRLVTFLFGKVAPFFLCRVFPLLFVASSVLVLVFGMRDVRLGKESASWPSVPGVIVYSAVERVTRSSTDVDDHDDIDYRVAVRYEYTVNRTDYEGARLQFLAPSHDRREPALVEQDRFPVGEAVSVFYDPEAPSVSTLITGVGRGSRVLIGLCSLFIMIGAALFFTLPVLWRKMLSARADNGTPTDSGEADWHWDPTSDDD